MGRAFVDAFSTRVMPILLVAIFFLVPSGWAVQHEGVTTVHAVGSSNIQGADMSASRNKAIAEGLVAAVTRVLTEVVTPESVVGNFQIISESILSQTDQFVLGYSMLTESTYASQHRVMVQATISIERLRDVLKQSGVYIGAKKNPNVLFFIAEKQVNDMNFQYWWGGQQAGRAGTVTSELSRVFGEKGFMVVSPDAVALRQAYSPKITVREAVALGREMQADVVVIGEALAEEAAMTAGVTQRSFRGSLSVGAYRVGSGEEIGRAQQVSNTTAGDPLSGGTAALERTSRFVGEDLSEQVLKAWFSEDAGDSKVEIQVEGLAGNIANFVKFRGKLSNMSGVGSVQRKKMDSNAAKLLVDYQGNATALADALMRQSFDTFSLNIVSSHENTIQLNLVPH